mmetsp:Transcript_38216/g.62522  ORF Transcript_38216/g.62522 Transcript_38216/m.62522 type:complete len:221 (-) Transcript_38216:43-705(-)
MFSILDIRSSNVVTLLPRSLHLIPIVIRLFQALEPALLELFINIPIKYSAALKLFRSTRLLPNGLLHFSVLLFLFPLLEPALLEFVILLSVGCTAGPSLCRSACLLLFHAQFQFHILFNLFLTHTPTVSDALFHFSILFFLFLALMMTLLQVVILTVVLMMFLCCTIPRLLSKSLIGFPILIIVLFINREVPVMCHIQITIPRLPGFVLTVRLSMLMMLP